MAFDLRAQRLLCLLAVIGVVKTHGIETTARKQPQAPLQRVEFFEVEQHPERRMAQIMPARTQSPMDDDANKKCGVRRHAALRSAGTGGVCPAYIRPDSLATVHGRRTPPTASLTANPACRPSS
jgi:hypothetical protein